MHPPPPKLLKLMGYFSRINKKAYQDEFLLANDVLAKVYPIVNVLDAYVLGRNIRKTTFLFIVKKFFLFYAKNLVWFFFQVVKKLIFTIIGPKFPLEKLDDKFVFIDTFFLGKQIAEENHFRDPYFPGLVEALDKLGTEYVYVPKFALDENWLVFLKMLRVLKREKTPVLTEYQVLGAKEFFRLFGFIAFYPFHVIRLIRSLEDNFEDRLARFALYSFSGLSGRGYFRLLYGEKLSELPVSRMKCVSWYENQAADKCFYKGLRKISNKALIYGAQFFIWSSGYLHVQVDEQEIEFDIVPDKILVNGSYFLNDEGRVNFQIGPSLRYKEVFQTQMDPSKMEDILVLFPYWDSDIRNILTCLKDISFDRSMKFKFHPVTDVENYRDMIYGKAKVVEGNIYPHFKRARMVIAAATGAMVEAASLGIPVINIVNNSEISFNYLPDYGKGVLWDSAATGAELSRLIEKFDYALENERDKLAESAAKIKGMFFCEPTEEKIIEAFDLV
jgi:hypothetical protein